MGSNTIQPSSPQVQQALGAIRKLVRALRLGDSDIERATGISSAQLFVLKQLTMDIAPSINELAERTATDQSSVSTVVTRLERQGLVKRAPSRTDARRVTVTITARGLDVVKSAPITIQDKVIRALATLPAPSLASLTQELSTLVTLLGAAEQPPSFFFEDDATGAH